MRNLLYKEFRLALHPSMFIYLACSALLLIPSWPFFVAFVYLVMGFMTMFFTARSNQDIFFTACLPIRKRDAVFARVYSVASFELMQIIAAIPFAYLNTLINPHGNGAGMNPNFAFFGFVLIMFAIFNSILFPWFYKTAYKVGTPLIFAILGFMLFGGIVETVVHTVPVLTVNLNAFGAGHLGSQLIVLLSGIAIFFGLTWLAAKQAAKRFEKVDL
jgi:ABC-2 type transport system permease protein